MMIFDYNHDNSLQDLDEDIGTEAIPEEQRITKDTVSRLVTASSGACCCTAIVKDGTVHVAGLGDCRAVLGRNGCDIS